MYRVQSRHSLHWVILELLKRDLAHFLTSDKISSLSRNPFRLGKRLSSVRLPPLKTWRAKLAHTEEKYSASGLHAAFARKQQTAQLNGLLPKETSRKRMGNNSFFAASTVFPLAAALMERSPVFVERYGLLWMMVLHSQMLNKVLLEFRSAASVKGELVILRSEI